MYVAQPAHLGIGGGAAVEQLVGEEAKPLVLLPLHLAAPAAGIGPESEFFPADQLASHTSLRVQG